MRRFLTSLKAEIGHKISKIKIKRMYIFLIFLLT